MDAYKSLRGLAQAAGIEARLHEASPDTMRALLGALGIAPDTEADVEAGLAFFAEEPWREPLPPVIVARENSELDVPIRLPLDDRTIRWTIRLETGGIRTGECDLGALQVEDMGRFGETSVALPTE